MGRTFIIGAGFSKALADTPLVKEFVGPIYNKAFSKELTNAGYRGDLEESFLRFIEILKESIENGLQFLETDGTKIKNRSGNDLVSSLNIEQIFTLLDLNIERPFIPKGDGIDLQGCPIPYIKDFYVFNLKEAKSYLIHQIINRLFPSSLKINKELCSRFSEYIEPGDVIITFNYDLLIEQILWDAKLWSPLDGYLFGKLDDNIKLNKESTFSSQVPILKIHGSINWQPPSFFENDIVLNITHPMTHEPFFQGMDYSFRVKPSPRNVILNSFLITPTFMKHYQSKYELFLIKTAIDSISKSDEIISLGYSFPEADSMTTFILTQIPEHCTIKIIDIDANNIKEKLVKTYGYNMDKIINESSSITDWIEGDFRFSSYQKHMSEQKKIDEFLSRLEQIKERT